MKLGGWFITCWLIVLRVSSHSWVVDAFAVGTWGIGGSSERRADVESKALRLQLEKICSKKDATLSFRHVQPTMRQEIEMLARNLVKMHGSPIPLDEMNTYLPGSSWRLAYSNRDEIVGKLPSIEASIHLKFKGGKREDDDDNDNDKSDNRNDDFENEEHQQRVDYEIQFHKNSKNKKVGALSGVESLKMGCTWQSAAGLIVFEEDDDDEEQQKIQECPPPPKTIIEDIANRSVERNQGLLSGRSRFIKTTYFDGDVWIERGKANNSVGIGQVMDSSNSNKSFTNIYLREDYEPLFDYTI